MGRSFLLCAPSFPLRCRHLIRLPSLSLRHIAHHFGHISVAYRNQDALAFRCRQHFPKDLSRWWPAFLLAGLVWLWHPCSGCPRRISTAWDGMQTPLCSLGRVPQCAAVSSRLCDTGTGRPSLCTPFRPHVALIHHPRSLQPRSGHDAVEGGPLRRAPRMRPERGALGYCKRAISSAANLTTSWSASLQTYAPGLWLLACR
jgi:hypothetical protein